MAIGKKIVATVGVLTLGGLVAVPMFIGAVGGLFSRDSCAANTSISSAEGSTLTGMSASDYLNQFSASSRDQKLVEANKIVQVGIAREESRHAINIAVAVGIQESHLTNLSQEDSDRDSAGVFQQRLSQNWGTLEQVRDTAHAAGSFFDRLDQKKNIESRPMIEVAISVQIPDKAAYYRTWKWDKTADEIVSMVTGPNAGSLPGAKMACAETGWTSPLEPKSYVLRSGFGMRINPVTFRRAMHDGTDLSAPTGTPIYAVRSGTIVQGYLTPSVAGIYLEIDHGDNIFTDYVHLSRIADGIALGTKVNTGDIIGYVGNTGRSTGSHLHFQIRIDGKYTDPEVYMRGVGVDLEKGSR